MEEYEALAQRLIYVNKKYFSSLLRGLGLPLALSFFEGQRVFQVPKSKKI